MPGGSGGGGGGQGGAPSSSGGSGGSGGSCIPTAACDYGVNCGMMDDGCGDKLDCDYVDPSQPATCAANGSPLVETGPMVCSPAHVCVCPPEGDTTEAMSFCEGDAAEPAVNDFCVSGGGCDTALCGIPPVPKAPKECTYSGRTLKPVPLDESTWIHIWCCVGPG